MFNEILKFGSMIVDALRTYQHPVFIYLPPNGELRGGAWVVVDPTINEKMMEMYADRESRGGILEPPGICEVKFRKQDQIKAMHRLDPVLLDLEAKLSASKDVIEIGNLKKQIAAREEVRGPARADLPRLVLWRLWADLVRARSPRRRSSRSTCRSRTSLPISTTAPAE
jgi:acetyl-CoA carboxylase carboxyltransferase component